MIFFLFLEIFFNDLIKSISDVSLVKELSTPIPPAIYAFLLPVILFVLRTETIMKSILFIDIFYYSIHQTPVKFIKASSFVYQNAS